ncbi:subtilisin-like protein protease SBT3.10 [Cinnamomum micranthum f. kanehirae]|uniref:Subtilisin-like protein protease SBT3.10 n=1 Tax=Cinnamomum micranthum f. kanehirae TaxID=337451 RepID=A0A3S3N1Q3_9MAGN|nr:subtilisin-like protein protease SBT3.10 [Cinnamomum micranthum f. kanehirae]
MNIINESGIKYSARVNKPTSIIEGVGDLRWSSFDYGGGLVYPSRVLDPGLIYYIHSAEYDSLFVECVGDVNKYKANFPSVCIPYLKTTAVAWRRVTNVGELDAAYEATIIMPAFVDVVVEPSTLTFSETMRTRSFRIHFQRREEGKVVLHLEASHGLTESTMLGFLLLFSQLFLDYIVLIQFCK